MSKRNRTYANDPDGTRLPIKVDSTSNGEFMPRPLSATHIKANRMALENCDANARNTGQHRRDFLVSTAGAATTLLALNEAQRGRRSARQQYVLPWEARFEEAAAKDALDGDEFIFDIQGHHVGNIDSWWKVRRSIPRVTTTSSLPPGGLRLRRRRS